MKQSNTNPYELTTTQGLRGIDSIRNEVAKQAIVDKNDQDIYSINEQHGGVGSFEHPMLFKSPGVEAIRVAIDNRLLRGTTPIVKEQRELLMRRAALTLHCARNNSGEDLFDSGVMLAYAHIVSGIIAGEYTIDGLTKLNVGIAAAVFYFFTTRPDGHVFGDDDFLTISKALVRHMPGITSQMVDSVINVMTPGRRLQDLVDSIKAVDGTDRTMMFTTGVLINASNRLWNGVNADMIVGIMLEHPPTFAAMVLAATGEGFYGRGEMAKRLKGSAALRKRLPHTHSFLRGKIEAYQSDDAEAIISSHSW